MEVWRCLRIAFPCELAAQRQECVARTKILHGHRCEDEVTAGAQTSAEVEVSCFICKHMNARHRMNPIECRESVQRFDSFSTLTSHPLSFSFDTPNPATIA